MCRNYLVELNELSIPSCYHPSDIGKIRKFEIHAFSDASERAIATVIYVKLVYVEGHISIYSLTHKRSFFRSKRQPFPG